MVGVHIWFRHNGCRRLGRNHMCTGTKSQPHAGAYALYRVAIYARKSPKSDHQINDGHWGKSHRIDTSCMACIRTERRGKSPTYLTTLARRRDKTGPRGCKSACSQRVLEGIGLEHVAPNGFGKPVATCLPFKMLDDISHRPNRTDQMQRALKPRQPFANTPNTSINWKPDAPIVYPEIRFRPPAKRFRKRATGSKPCTAPARTATPAPTLSPLKPRASKNSNRWTFRQCFHQPATEPKTCAR